jgi:hypothetical protein
VRPARQLRIAATVRLLELDALSAAEVLALPPDEGGAGRGLAIGTSLPFEHLRLRAMLLGMMGGPAGGT